MDESADQFAPVFAPPYVAGLNSPYGVFEIDPMKRSMEELKKPRWSPPNQTNIPSVNTPARANFENYATYGPGGAPSPIYTTTPSNMNMGFSPMMAVQQINGLNQGMNGHAQQQPGSAGGYNQHPPSPLMQTNNAYGMNGMAMAGFPYGGLNGMGGMAMGLASPYPFTPQVAASMSQQQNSRIPNGLNLLSNPSYASAAAAAAAAAAAGNQTGRTVYVGNLPTESTIDELLNLVRFGPLEAVRIIPEKNCVFLSFLDGVTAAAFHADATSKKLALRGNELRIGWGKATPVPSQVMLSITQSNASRNVYLGGLDEETTEADLRDDLSRFGLIDQVKIVRDKNIGFVHFLNISTATKVVATLPTEPAWAGKRVNYGKDRCAYVRKSDQRQMINQAQASPLAVINGFNNFQDPTANPAFAMQLGMFGGGQSFNRTVYLGNIHPETTTEDLCNSIRGGMLQSIRYMHDKHIAFVMFIDPAAAFTFYQVATFQGLTLNNRRLKVGWGKNSGPLSPAVALAVHSGATRNVYIGNIEDFELFTEERLKRDFGEYGDIELINFLKEKNCAFVNFTNISNAIKAIDAIKNKADYANLRVSYGKDRCANPPRSGPQGGGGGKRNGGRVASSTGLSPAVVDVDVADSAVHSASGEDQDAMQVSDA